MKTMCRPGYHHNGFMSTWAHDVRYRDAIHSICNLKCDIPKTF